MSYETGTQQYRLGKMHKRNAAKSTKVGNNTYARHEQVTPQTDNTNETWLVTIQYHATDIIRCLYEIEHHVVPDTQPPVRRDTLWPLMVEIDTDGWLTRTTIKRINAFFVNNFIPARMSTRNGEGLLKASPHTGLPYEPHENLYDNRDDTAVIQVAGCVNGQIVVRSPNAT